MEFFTNNLTTLIGGGTSAIVLWVLKKIPNEDIYSWVETGGRWVGTIMTAGLSKFSLTRKYWQKNIEPWVIDLIDNTCGAFVSGVIQGLRSDD